MFQLFPRAIRPEICDAIVKDCASKDLKLATVLNPDDSVGDRDDPSVRKTLVYFVPPDRDNKANNIAWHFIKEANRILFNYDITHFQPTQFAKYKDGGFYDWHIDASYQDEIQSRRKLSLSFILTDPDEFEGGELQFFNGNRPLGDKNEDDEKVIKNDLKAKGTVVVFDSRDFHRVTPVTSGVRYSIVCWAVGPNFK